MTDERQGHTSQRAIMGIRLAELRSHAQLSQERLSSLVGMCPARLARVESGLDHIEADVLSRLCVVLGVEPISLFMVDCLDTDPSGNDPSACVSAATSRHVGRDSQYLSRLKEAFSNRANALVH